MDFVIIEIIQEKDNKVIACKVRYICNDLTEAKKMYNTLKEEIIRNKVLLIPNIKMDDIPNIMISDYTEDVQAMEGSLYIN